MWGSIVRSRVLELDKSKWQQIRPRKWDLLIYVGESGSADFLALESLVAKIYNIQYLEGDQKERDHFSDT